MDFIRKTSWHLKDIGLDDLWEEPGVAVGPNDVVDGARQQPVLLPVAEGGLQQGLDPDHQADEHLLDGADAVEDHVGAEGVLDPVEGDGGEAGDAVPAQLQEDQGVLNCGGKSKTRRLCYDNSETVDGLQSDSPIGANTLQSKSSESANGVHSHSSCRADCFNSQASKVVEGNACVLGKGDGGILHNWGGGFDPGSSLYAAFLC